MLRNYFKVMLRTFKKQKVYSLINMAGLTIGMTCCILILLWVVDELSYDRFHEHADDLYRVIQEHHYSDEITYAIANSPGNLASALKAEFPEIIDASRYFNTGWSLQYEDHIYSQDGAFADPDFLKMFTILFTKGNPETALSDPLSIVLTEGLARKFFGDQDPLGRILKIDDALDVTVTGVVEKLPRNSHLTFDYIIPLSILTHRGFPTDTWEPIAFVSTYVRLKKGIDQKEVDAKIRNMVRKNSPESPIRLFLQPVTRIHLYEPEGGGAVTYVVFFSAVAFFILLIACINFMNLTTARSGVRAREVGMRKVVGALRKNLSRQFLGESIVMSLLSLMITLVLIHLILPSFNQLSGKELSLNMMENWTIFMGMLGIAVITGVGAGSYPALFLSAFQPVKVLKGSLKSGSGSSWFRRILVVFQFTLSILLLICTILIYRQLHYIRTKPLGFNQELLFTARMASSNVHYETVKKELLNDPHIISVTATDRPPTYRGDGVSDVDWEGKDPHQKLSMQIRYVNYDYFQTFDMEILEGRSFSSTYPTDESEGLIINQTAAEAMGLRSPVGERITVHEKSYVIKGIVKDFHLHLLYQKIEPLLLILRPKSCLYICVRMTSDQIPKTLELMESKWDRLDPGYPFQYIFLDDRIDRLYRSEQRMCKIITTFTILAVFISCLGLFGLASFMTELRTREIGIRKVLGASIGGIVLLLSKEFTRWVFIANIIAWPIAYFVGKTWLQGFAYRIPMAGWMFFLSGGMAFFVALLSVGFQSVKAALIVPAESIKYE